MLQRIAYIKINCYSISSHLWIWKYVFSVNDNSTGRRNLDQVEEIRSELVTKEENNVLRRKNCVAGVAFKECGQDTIAAHIQELFR